jgi:hypothetical protein
MSVVGRAIDWIEDLSHDLDDPELRPAGFAEPHYPVSERVTVSRDDGLYVYHVSDDQLGLGSSLGNARAWIETKGNGDLLRFFSIDVGGVVLGGLSIVYLLPFSDLSAQGMPPKDEGQGGGLGPRPQQRAHVFSRAMPSAKGSIHLHPAYQQREIVIGDGLHVLESMFVQRTGMEDPPVVLSTVALRNQTPHPLRIIVVASLALRGTTERDLVARYDRVHGVLIAHNRSRPEWARVFGASHRPNRHWATTDEEGAYTPGASLPSRADEEGDLTGALQFEMTILPRQVHKLRIAAAFSHRGEDEALHDFEHMLGRHDALKETIAHYREVLDRASVDTCDPLLSHGIQWAKACMLRPISRYAVGDAFTNDPCRSNRLVGRDMAWFAHGADYVVPESVCDLLRILSEHQREDGLIPEWVDGVTNESEDHGFNINDNTPLFVMAAAHHLTATADHACRSSLYAACLKAGQLILKERDEHGLVCCAARGTGLKGIAGWRNVIMHEQITGVVTEINAECYAALRAIAEMARLLGKDVEAERFAEEAGRLKHAVNRCLINPANGLYVRNVDLEGRIFTQATVDLVIPLICDLPEPEIERLITARLAEPDFMSEAGIRALPTENPRYDPSSDSGCLGGVWPGATWWYAMGARRTHPSLLADSLRRSYWHYVADPKTFNTVPGQFSEWSDGQTLVNRGMRLSPWEAPRFLWGAVEGLAGIKLGAHPRLRLDPRMPLDWSWLAVRNLPYREERLSFFIARQSKVLNVYTMHAFDGFSPQHLYSEAHVGGAETLTTGLSTTVLEKEGEILICLGSSLDVPSMGPFLAHQALSARKRYHVLRLTSLDDEWRDLGRIEGSRLQRIAVRVEGAGYALYRFRPES